MLVDGPFVQSLRDETLPFRGSSNQRLIDVQASLKGDLEFARKLAIDLNDVSKNLFIDVNPIMPKAALKHMGIIKNASLRRPLIETTKENKDKLFKAMDLFESKRY